MGALDSKIVERTFEPIGDESVLGYITSYKSNLKRLEIEVQKLETKKNNLQYAVDEVKKNEEIILNIVENWLKKVDVILDETKKLIDNDVHAKFVPNLWFWHQLSKKSQNMIQMIHQVLKEGNFEKISYSKPSTLKEINQALNDPNIYMIGLYGIDGVGKTTLLKELARKVKKGGLFDALVMVEVTDSLDVENIQDQIANMLDLKFDEKTKEGRVGQLYQRIKEEKSILIILDDVWGKLDLAKVGIPFGDDHKGCKLLLTSEYVHVLKHHMGTQKDFKLEVLSDEDSWKLFENILGNDVKMKNARSIAQDLAKCCNGLPLFIAVVAKALRKRSVSTWKHALNQLKGLDERGNFKPVVCPLEFSYNNLESNDLRSLFLFIVSLGPGRIHTGELFSSYFGLMGLYGDVNTLAKARKKYYKLINDLTAASLLVEDEIEYVRMHDAVRDMAKAIAFRTDLTYEVRNFTQMEQWDMDQLQRCRYINLPSYNIDELPEKLDCPNLRMMSLKRNHGHLTIPDNFFSGMIQIKALNLHGMRFSPSPSSLYFLTNLISLNLYGCLLEDITIIGQLSRLEILTLERSEIEQLPKEIGHLVYLRMLNLTNCYQLKTIPANLLSCLTRLEELYMGNCNVQWEVGKEKDHASLRELSHLNQLTTLDLSIQDASALPDDDDMRLFGNLQRYNISIGYMWKWSSLWSRNANDASRILKLADSFDTRICLNGGVKILFTTVEDLSLDKLNFVKDGFFELNGERFSKLKHLKIQNSDALCNLERLILYNVPNMEDISYGALPTHSFENLKCIKVQSCDKLKKLLLHSLAKGLYQLHTLDISNCKAMEEIIYEDKIGDEKEIPNIMLPKLHSLTLDTLPRFQSFSFSLTVDKDYESISNPLFNQKVTMPNLETLELGSINTCMIWDDRLPLHSCIQNLTSLKIDSCCGIRNLFTAPVVRALVKLEHLQITYCSMLEDIFVQEEKVTFPNLKTLVMSDNDKLVSIWPNQLAPNSFCNLKTTKIYGTKILNHIFPLSVIEELQQLQVLEISRCRINNIVEKTSSGDVKDVYCESLHVSWCYKLETVISSSVSFLTLHELKVDNCGVANIITPSMAPCLPNLRIINISSCKMLKEIVGSNNESNAPSEIALMKLCELNFENLPSLTSFCRGSYHFNLPSLEKVCAIRCSKFVTFCHGNITSPDLSKIIQHGQSIDDHPALFSEKVAMPNLQTLELYSLNVRNIWDGSLPFHFYNTNFCLEVKYCVRLKSLFLSSSSMFGALDKLQRLEIIHCDELVEIFVGQKEATFPELETLYISEMEHLQIIWHNQQASNSFHKLYEIEIHQCPALLHVFPIDVAKELRQLQVLVISYSNIESIIEKSDSQDLQSVYFEHLTISKCNRLKTILQSSVQFQTLCTLNVWYCDEVINIMMPLMITNLPRLCILHISGCAKLEQIYGKKNEGDTLGEIAFTKLETLHLEDLHRLTHFCKESCNFNFPSLRSVFIKRCYKMKTFTQKDDDLNNPSAVSNFPLFNKKVAMPNLESLEVYAIGSSKIWDDKLPIHIYSQNLTTLKVGDCDGLGRLFLSSKGRALDKLQHLKIDHCKELVEIFGIQEDDDAPTEIVFMKLEQLELISLPSLTSFCKASCTFKFPVLERVWVQNCPELTTFCPGNLITPSLSEVEYGELKVKDQHWDGDLNTYLSQKDIEPLSVDDDNL
ncbi:hypothetical protein VNO78_13413 [Psophocarpus tetragonolobus]|uniref:AAA+ ATPase domain-containing protein n=1 Tax=Psophocarpus tetragonolobus TaxID=3891 RepID=A0AAN9SP39_PSOTE